MTEISLRLFSRFFFMYIHLLGYLKILESNLEGFSIFFKKEKREKGTEAFDGLPLSLAEEASADGVGEG